MNSNELLKARVQKIGSTNTAVGSCVLYVMSRDQRVQDNYALLAAQKHALAKKLPLAVVFCLLPSAKGRAREHYEFMLAGLEQVESDLTKLNIPFMMVIGDPYEKLSAVFHHTKPDAVYFDFSPLRGPRALQQKLARPGRTTGSGLARVPAMYVVDTHNVIPTWVVSEKREVGAYTIRPKIHKLFAAYLVEPEQLQKHPYIWPGDIKPIKSLKSLIDEVLRSIMANNTKISFKSGEKAAYKHLENFINTKLTTYGTDRNDPTKDGQSDLSPYLHFGQISALRVALRLQQVAITNGSNLHLLTSPKMPKPETAPNTQQYSIDALLEEMIVRKELADNYCLHTVDYDNLNAATLWAQTSLDKHRSDVREHLYTYEQLEQAQTHDPAWNAAQMQLTSTGKMHGYMRMYWAKKVLEWTESPELAIEFLVKLNDFYSIDGGDPNGYAGILWSVGAVHDRPWGEREVFGVVRYMNYEGLRRKFAIDKYLH
jgi:deoxyribodipyrimidine photo-lyase